MATKAQTKADRQEALELLRRFCPQHATIYWVIRSVSRSGMSRRVDYYTFLPDTPSQSSKVYLTRYMAKALGLPVSDEGIRTYSADDPIYHLSYALFGHEGGMKLRAERI